MEYQRIINLLNNKPNEATKFRPKNWVETNDESRGTHNTNSQIRFKTSVLMTIVCSDAYIQPCIDAYILFEGTITVANTAAARAAANNVNKMVIVKNCVPFTSCMNRINNIQIDDAQYINVVLPAYNSIEYTDNYSKTSGILFQYCR